MRGSDGKQITRRLAASFLGATSSFLLLALAAFATTPVGPRADVGVYALAAIFFAIALPPLWAAWFLAFGGLDRTPTPTPIPVRSCRPCASRR